MVAAAQDAMIFDGIDFSVGRSEIYRRPPAHDHAIRSVENRAAIKGHDSYPGGNQALVHDIDPAFEHHAGRWIAGALRDDGAEIDNLSALARYCIIRLDQSAINDRHIAVFAVNAGAKTRNPGIRTDIYGRFLTCADADGGIVAQHVSEHAYPVVASLVVNSVIVHPDADIGVFRQDPCQAAPVERPCFLTIAFEFRHGPFLSCC